MKKFISILYAVFMLLILFLADSLLDHICKQDTSVVWGFTLGYFAVGRWRNWMFNQLSK